MALDCTLVVVVDRKHHEELKHTLPTWKRNRQAVDGWPLLVVYDRHELRESDLDWLWGPKTELYAWPPVGVDETLYRDQRHKMLSAFCFAPAHRVKTEWWLKIDTDAVAQPSDDPFPDESWFRGRPAMVSNPWGYTKPPDIMMRLDEWAARRPQFVGTDPLNLVPEPGSSVLSHRRIISWLMFCRTDFSVLCSQACETFGVMPVESQDSFFWYCAERLGFWINYVKFKRYQWEHWLRLEKIRERAMEAMR